MSIVIGEISCKDKMREFKQYLDSTDRMILSAQFGDGKTFFLQKVREDEEITSIYKLYTLYPVNYQVAENDDIFEYIKRDILFQMAKDGLLNSIDLDTLIASFASYETFKEILTFLVSCMPAGDFINKLIDKGLAIKDKYEEKKTTLKKFDATFKAMRGGIYEDDTYTQIIRAGLDELRNSINIEGGNRKSILVIEDLDRLDPGHLFRILNVISAHIDDTSKPDKVGNKFGFDKIILVMDYETTRYIFEHFYGKHASYDGYMSKFISHEPFRYSLKELVVNKFVDELVKIIGMRELNIWMGSIERKLQDYSVRDIIKLCDFDYNTRILKKEVIIHGNQYSTELPIFKLLIYLAEMGVRLSDVLNDLKSLSSTRPKESIIWFYPMIMATKDVSELHFEIDEKASRDDDGKNVYGVSFQISKEGLVRSISCGQSMMWNTTPIAIADERLDEDLEKALPLFTKSINLSSLNRNELKDE